MKEQESCGGIGTRVGTACHTKLGESRGAGSAKRFETAARAHGTPYPHDATCHRWNQAGSAERPVGLGGRFRTRGEVKTAKRTQRVITPSENVRSGTLADDLHYAFVVGAVGMDGTVPQASVWRRAIAMGGIGSIPEVK